MGMRSPSAANAVYETVTQAGASFVDGGIIGPPPEKPGDARLYLSGEKAHDGSPFRRLGNGCARD